MRLLYGPRRAPGAPQGHFCTGPSGASTPTSQQHQDSLARRFRAEDERVKAAATPDLSRRRLSNPGSSPRGEPREARGTGPSASPGTFEGLPADLAEVGPALLVAAGHMPQQGPLLREALLAELTAEGPLTRVRAVVLVQAGCGDKAGPQSPGLGPRTVRGWACLTLGAEGLPTEVALEGLLACVRAQVHVEISLLGEGVAAELTDIRPLVPVRVGDTDAITKGCGPLRSAPDPRKPDAVGPAPG